MPALDRRDIWGLHYAGQQGTVAGQPCNEARLPNPLRLGLPQRAQVLVEQFHWNLTASVVVDEVAFARFGRDEAVGQAAVRLRGCGVVHVGAPGMQVMSNVRARCGGATAFH
jgi:hypothetical protein